MTLPASYEDTFRKFDAADGRWIFTWNWAAFWFGLFWYLYRGLWLKAIIYFVALLILSGITAGLVTLFCWVGFGALANYDLYLLRRKGTQLWNGGGVAPDAVPGVTITPTMQVNSAVTRLAALDKARSQGLVSEFEYVEKRQQLELDAEREKKLEALEEMRRSGILSPMEYEAKKRDIMTMTAVPVPA